MLQLKHYYLPLGFSVPMALMIALFLVGQYSMEQINSRLAEITESNNIKISLVTTMTHAAKSRTLSLYRMITLEDAFDRDDAYLTFNSHGARFANARIALLKMNLTDIEKELLDKQAKTTGSAVESQNSIIDLTIGEKPSEAIVLLYEDTIPKQEQVFNILSDLLNFQQSANNKATLDAKDHYQKAKMLMILFGSLAVLLGLIVAFFTIRHTTKTEKSLYLEKQKAEITLHSIGDGVLTTNEKGRIEYLNPVAEQITGWQLERAKGLPLLKVFNIQSIDGSYVDENPVEIAITEQRIIEAANHFIFNDEEQKQYALEHTCGPMTDHDGKIIGAVLIFRNITEIRNMTLEMAHQATHDSLTGLINRAEFETQLELALEESRRDDRNHILVYLDLDQFKVVNDTCGHIAGDELLKQLVQLMQSNLRRSDILARLGGDEFGLLLKDCPVDVATVIAEKLRKKIKDFRFNWQDKSFVVGASFGIVEITPNCGTITDLLSAADSACYVSKDLGRDRIHVYSENDEELSQRQGEMQWLPIIRDALENDNFCVFCQQILSLDSTKPDDFHYEILIRMRSEDGKIIPPMGFLPSAERYHLMPDIDRWIIKSVFGFLNSNKEAFDISLYTWSINLSGQSICDDDFLQFIIDRIEETGIKPSSICFEITETAAVANLTRATDFITRLKEIGCSFSLDDFGSGLSSFTYLKNLPVDYLKIDGSFVKDMIEDEIDRAMVESINQIGQTMNLRTIAEFVENDQILQSLKEIGVDYAQGYGIHVPQAIDELFIEKIKR